MSDAHYSYIVAELFIKTLEKSMPETNPKASRRGFFFGAAATAAASVAVTALPKLQAPEPTAPGAQPAPTKGGGYTLSEHVKRYYQTTRI